jgi:patatin-like phospholipase
MEPPLDFEKLFRQEDALLGHAKGARVQSDLPDFKTETPGPAGEPWVRYTPFDRVGLAFSGGGIRSATFNLGVLKALDGLRIRERRVLELVDYLSTVSGGGYIGAWWTAWRARTGKPFPEALPDPKADKNIKPEEENREPEEVRHLREFSNFLSPRIGFFESEMWNAVMAVLSAMLPAVLVASSVIALAFLVWLGANTLILADALAMPMPLPDWLKTLAGCLAPSRLVLNWIRAHDVLALAVLSLVMVVTYILFEFSWYRNRKAEQLPAKWRIWFGVFHVTMPALIILGIYLGWHFLKYTTWTGSEPPGNVPRWKWSTGISPDGCGFSFSPHLFDAPILWAGIALTLLVPRLIIMRFFRERCGTLVNTVDRALSRLIGAALVFAVLSVLWLAGCWLHYTHWGKSAAGGAFASGGAFALLRRWVGNLGPAKKGGVMDIIKPLIPQILAYVAIALWAICIAALVAGCTEKDFSFVGISTPWLLFFGASGIVLFAIFFFDPAQVSLHSFYRNRLARAYLGASNLDAKQSSENRQTDVRRDDDIELRKLSPRGRERPIHLVCCAANDLGGDQLGNLSRGARSSVLSRFGLGIGNYWHAWEEDEDKKALGLASAITASAAAFNSNMGSLSMTLGKGVTFLCSALNLRLGLWLGHPRSNKIGAPKLIPGWLFLKEMFGQTNSGLRPPPPENPRKPVAKYVHLSDGGHFENLALYELVRRHCRYIIVSDCGADPQVAFDDFGNAVRRIREDFGVEIDIDLSPLEPNTADRLSKQHVAVGTISYDPRGDQKDTGILLYLKPTLTGDEPVDITQYRTRNKDFPHETTGDQFYDEAQWESYRRLGEHATRSALRFIERERPGASLSPEAFKDAVFNGARWEWYQSPEGLKEKFVELTGRFTALETELREQAPEKFVREIFPELQTIKPKFGSHTPMNSKEMSRVLHFLLQIIQLMEDVWIGCQLETHWNDPNNLGWMNAFQRWAYTPSFRLWWPILKPMYGSKFRRFMDERLSLADEDYPPTIATVNKHGKVPPGVAQIYLERMYKEDPAREAGKTVYSFDLKLTLQRPQRADIEYHIQAGLAFLDLSAKPIARWTNEEFFIPPSLWGAGLGATFLDELLKTLKKEENIKECEVTIEPPPDEKDAAFSWMKRTDIAARQQLNDLLAFYQRAGFTLGANKKLVRNLDDIIVDADAANGSDSDD